MSDSEDEDTHPENRQLKVVLLGDGTTGKTSIATRLAQNQFGKTYQQTLGLDFFSKTITLPGDVSTTLQVWDIGGQTIGGKMLENYVYGAHAVLFVYDITNYSSFENLDDWLSVVKRVCFRGDHKPPHMALIANKMDMEHMRTVRRDRHGVFANKHNMSSHFLSAKSDDQINSCFLKVAAATVGISLTNVDIDRTSTVVKADIVQYKDSSSEPRTPRKAKIKTTKSSICVIQ